MLTFVDTNVFIRLAVVADNDKQAKQAKRLFEQAQAGNIDLLTGPPVLFEVAWVLGRFYKRANSEILDFLEAILSFPNLRVLDKELVMKTLEVARKTKSTFADSYIAVSSRSTKADNVATFNGKHFLKLGVKLYAFEETE
jgi:predicted nucleic-acid-binding protein